MLRLWNRYLGKIRPAPPGTISLGFSGNSIVAVRAVREVDHFCISHMAEEKLPFSPFVNSVSIAENFEILSQAMRRIAELVPQNYWPLQIALPDAAAIVQVMQFDSLPVAEYERESIAKFRLEKEFPTLTPMQCTTQDISSVGKPGLLLTTFFQRSWLESLNTACRNAGYVPSVVDISISHLFNRFYDLFTAASGDGALVFVEQGSWSLLIWDADHCPRFVRSRWIENTTELNDEYDLIVQDVERLILSYVLRDHRRRVEGIYICADVKDRVPLAALLDKRMKVPCVQLDVNDGFSVLQGLSMDHIPSSVLAAAVPRL